MHVQKNITFLDRRRITCRLHVIELYFFMLTLIFEHDFLIFVNLCVKIFQKRLNNNLYY